MRMFSMIKGPVCILACSLMMSAALAGDAAAVRETPEIAIIVSREMAPYNMAVDGFKKELDSAGFSVSYSEYDLQGMGGAAGKEIDEILVRDPELVYTIGTEASLFARKNIKDIPIVFAMVLNPVENGVVRSFNASGENITGVALNIKIEEQFSRIKEMAPGVKRVGMVYDGDRRKWLREEAEKAAGDLGIELVAKPVRSTAEAMDTVTGMCGEIDFLWAAADPVAYNTQSAKHMLLATLRGKKPFMAYSENYVKAGALMAMECDYGDIGREAGRMAGEILSGRDPGTISVAFPRMTRTIINRRTAQTIGVEIPEKMIKGGRGEIEIIE